jgi:anti-sigma B factor antagonist
MAADFAVFSVSVAQTPTGPVVTPHGDIDMATTDELERAAADQMSAGESSLTIDLSDVDFCDSAGINSLVKIKKRCSAAGGQFGITGARPHIFHVFAVSGLVEFLGVQQPTGGSSLPGDSELHH